MTPDSQQIEVLEALLEQVPQAGWTEAALRRALGSLGRPEDDAPLLFPNGPMEMIEVFASAADGWMEADAAAADVAALRVSARVREIIALRLARNRPHRQAIRRALAVLALPGNAAAASRITARTVDAVWHAAGDGSADFSWYTKRGILAGVYGATLLFWVGQDADDDAATLAFLDRQLASVGKISRLRARISQRLESLRFGFEKPSGAA